MVERGGPQMTIWRMRIACWIPKATNTTPGYVILITFALQQWFARTRLNLTSFFHRPICFTAKIRSDTQRTLQKLPSTNTSKFLIN